ncbi:hypothetical protein D7X55_26775 [Corallococcus sp. AB049A]|uniref:Tetratricopeptide repeat protein n=1 Tax=Corallococcus interemptor TaxID=2316720 RepID=A0A3A8QU83_9BACT|nr:MULTISPECIES: hypothetical protein [Corallococcus]RKH72117.1 hypothetical protein D7X96_05825 [Corallococcus interemptor]RKI58737.1 hypothetical protein D7X55_26775 [Corallococcus sp. AB049A]
MGYFLEDPRSYEKEIQKPNLGWGGHQGMPTDTPVLELDASQAPAVFDEAVAALAGQPSESQVSRAAGDIAAACDAGYEKACQFLKEQTRLPERIEGTVLHPQGAGAAPARAEYAVVIVKCRIETDERVRGCQAIEDGSGRPSERLIPQLEESRYRPWSLAGHAVATPYTFTLNLRRGGTGGDDLLVEQKLGWARMRVAHFPQSTGAWINLAMQLAVHTPEDPDYPKVLAQAYALAPLQKWLATEMAWQRIQQGQHTAALMALRPVLRRSMMGSRPNPYVLETAAAAHFGLNQCTEALAEQQKAVELLPAEWPAPERERFQRKLQDYRSACAVPKDVSAGTGPR